MAEFVFKQLDDEEKKYVCKECGEEFTHGQALGGHMSRTHPG